MSKRNSYNKATAKKYEKLWGEFTCLKNHIVLLDSYTGAENLVFRWGYDLYQV